MCLATLQIYETISIFDPSLQASCYDLEFEFTDPGNILEDTSMRLHVLMKAVVIPDLSPF